MWESLYASTEKNMIKITVAIILYTYRVEGLLLNATKGVGNGFKECEKISWVIS